MTLKEKLELIWNTPGVLCHSHIVQWHKHKEGCSLKFSEHEIYFKRGKKVELKIKNKLKYQRSPSYLSKYYYQAWINQFHR